VPSANVSGCPSPIPNRNNCSSPSLSSKKNIKVAIKMKLTTPLLILLSTFGAFGDELLDCRNELSNQFGECLVKYNDDGVCNAVKSEKCTNLFNNNASAVEKCKSLPDDKISIINEDIKSAKEAIDLYCGLTDENNKSCPILTISQDTPENRSKTVNETCKSEACTKKTLEFLRHNLGNEGEKQYEKTVFNKDFNIEEAGEGDNDFYVIAFLNSDYCKSKHVKTNAESSDSATIKYGGTLFTILSILYSLL